MPTSSYDVVVLGMRLPPLLCAALLAGRGLRVLVLGQGAPTPSYRLGSVEVERDPFPITGSRSPVVQRVFEELALKQEMRQRLVAPPRPFQLVLREHRVNLSSDADSWKRELTREAPHLRGQGLRVHHGLVEVSEQLDALMARTMMWPPETFFDRQQFALAVSPQRFDRRGAGWTSWEQLPLSHPIRSALEACLPLFSGLRYEQHSDASRARLYGHLFFDVPEFVGGFGGLQQALFSRIRSWGGDVRPQEEARAIGRDGRHGHILRLARSDEQIGCAQVVHGTPISELTQLIPEPQALEPLFESVGEPRIRAYRCSVHLLVRESGVPSALEPLGCVQAGPGDVAFLLQTRRIGEGRVLLTMSRTVDERLVDGGSSPMSFVREDALAALRAVVPFLDGHILWIDSPHDGLAPTTLQDHTDLSCSDLWSRGPLTMQPLFEYPTTRALGVCALPTRTPVHGIYLCNDQTAPGLGFEGSCLAATSAARNIGRFYRRQDWLRRGPWARHSL